MDTYVNVNALQWEDLFEWLESWGVSEELLLIAIPFVSTVEPFERVEGGIVKIVETGQLQVGALAHPRGNIQRDDAY